MRQSLWTKPQEYGYKKLVLRTKNLGVKTLRHSGPQLQGEQRCNKRGARVPFILENIFSLGDAAPVKSLKH